MKLSALISFKDRDNKKPLSIDPNRVVAVLPISTIEKRDDKGHITQKGGQFLYTEIYLDAGGNTIKVPVCESPEKVKNEINKARKDSQ